MPDTLFFGLWDNQSAFVHAAMWAGMMRQPEFVALGADGQLRQGDVIMRAPHIFF
jgi:hypothetical protein